MESLTHIYRDPLFGIAILVAIIALIVLMDYYRNFYKRKKREKSLNALVKSYEYNGFFDGIAEFLKVSKDPIPTLLFLAKSYTISGDNQQAIKIYLTLLKQIDDPIQRFEILQGLGNAYFQSGFLQKAKEVFLEILKNNPYKVDVLFRIVELYECLGEYQNALDALECIKENTNGGGDKASLSLYYLQARLIMENHQKNQEQKNTELVALIGKEGRLRKFILGYLKIYDLALFWEYLPDEGWENYIDLLWDFTIEQISQKVIAQSGAIEVFQAKGYYPSKGCGNFSLEIMRLFQTYSSQKANLSFSYQCRECLGEFPFDSFRCPNCAELGTMKLILKPQKARNEKNLSLL